MTVDEALVVLTKASLVAKPESTEPCSSIVVPTGFAFA